MPRPPKADLTGKGLRNGQRGIALRDYARNGRARLLPSRRRLKTAARRESPNTDAGLAELETLSGLKSLSLEKTAITDAGLMKLAGLKELVYLDVRGTKVTASGLSRLTSKHKIKHLPHDFPRIVPGVTIAVGERVPE